MTWYETDNICLKTEKTPKTEFTQAFNPVHDLRKMDLFLGFLLKSAHRVFILGQYFYMVECAVCALLPR